MANIILSREEFVKFTNLLLESIKREDEMQESVNTLFPTSFPIIDNPLWRAMEYILSTVTNDEFVIDWLYELSEGKEQKGWIGDEEYDISTPEKYYDFLSCAINKNAGADAGDRK